MQNKAKYLFWGKAFLCALLFVFVVRIVWIESYLISSSQMENALIKGDCVLVDKTSYGLRLPVTPLSVPFTFDSFLGMKSYSQAVQCPYTRIGAKKIPLNDVVVYNHPLQTDRPLDKRELCIGRCIAQPGDTLSVDGFDIAVNGRRYRMSPNFRLQYSLPVQWHDSLTSLFRQLHLSDTRVRVEQQSLLLSVNRQEFYLIQEYLPDSLFRLNGNSENSGRQVVIPRKGSRIRLDADNLGIYASMILQEQGKNLLVKEGQLYLNGKNVREYTFMDDYYWILSEHQIKAVDSDRLGFVSEKNIVGKAFLIWFSHNKRGFSWSRFFTRVN